MISAIGAIMSPKSWKIVGGVVGAIALLGLVYMIVSSVKSWQIDTYNDGFRAGALNVQQQWDQANSAALKEQRDQVVQDALNSNKAIKDYLDDIASRRPEVIKVKERTTEYVQSPDAGNICLTPDAVRLLQDNRKAHGFASAPEAGNPGAVPGTVSVAGPAQGQP